MAEPREAYRHLYDRRWRNARARFLQANPLCVYCEREGRVTVANVVDHVTPHKGDLSLFWDQSNWQAVCKPHHDGHKQSLEKGGHGRVAFGVDGWPLS